MRGKKEGEGDRRGEEVRGGGEEGVGPSDSQSEIVPRTINICPQYSAMPWNRLINSPPWGHTQTLTWIPPAFIITPCWGAACSLSDDNFSSVLLWNTELVVQKWEFLLPRWSGKAGRYLPVDSGHMGLWFLEQKTKTLQRIFGCLRTWCLLSKIKLLAY